MQNVGLTGIQFLIIKAKNSPKKNAASVNNPYNEPTFPNNPEGKRLSTILEARHLERSEK